MTIEVAEINKGKTTDKTANIRSWVIFLLVIGSIFFIFRYAITIIIVSGNSMYPTLENKHVILSYNVFYQIERHDVAVIEDRNGFDVVKRVIGLPNDTIEIQNGAVLVNGNVVEENYSAGTAMDMEPVILNDNEYFVIGDNREVGESLDSRSSEFGPVTKDQIKGEILLSLFPFKFLQ
ncbi:signal peptidase I [Bacillus kwashiorkori]|uniref:signal peptidase I n=1 Tax=Bacillus kwashiorkori TaxID=1522318 RepID=UPI000786811D|nr:signal peptidase I [Bacillus kwashiorkori]